MSIRFGEFDLDLGRRQMLRNGEEVHISPKALQLLRTLVERRPAAVSKKELYDAIWPDTYVAESNLASLVGEVRQALGDDSRKPEFVRTVHGFGYAFCAEATEAVPAESHANREPRGFLVWGTKIIPVHDGDAVLGRDGTADIVIEDTTVSRRHALISVHGETVVIRDLESKNGTWFDGRQIEGEAKLTDGDPFDLGSVRLEYRESIDSAPTASIDRKRIHED